MWSKVSNYDYLLFVDVLIRPATNKVLLFNLCGEQVDMDGNEDMSCRLLHVYQSKKRAGADISVKSKGVSSRPPKRKGKSVDNGMRKKNKLAGTSGNEMNRGAEHYGGVFPSPCLSHLSIDLGSPYYDFDINLTPMNETLGAKCTPINNMFGAKGTPINHIFGAEGTPAANNNFSFHPIQDVHSSSHGIENMMLNNPAFASAISSVAKSPANNHQQHNAASNGYYYGPFAHARYLSHPPHVGPAYYRDAVKAAPPIPHLPTSNQNALADGGEGKRVILTVTNFSQKLKEIEESLLTDVHSSNSADQVIKLQLLQNWSKAMASKPLQPRSDHALGVAHVSTTNTKAASCEKSLRVASEFRIASTTTQSDANKQVAVKVESPGPSLGSADGSAAAAQSIANTLVALKMEAPDEDTSMITPGSVV